MKNAPLLESLPSSSLVGVGRESSLSPPGWGRWKRGTVTVKAGEKEREGLRAEEINVRGVRERGESKTRR